MKKLIQFWNKDLINKLILIVAIGLIAGISTLGYLLMNMPADSMFYSVLPAAPGKNDGLPTMAAPIATTTPLPTPTTQYFPSQTPAATATSLENLAVPSPTATLPEPTPIPPTDVPTQVAETAVPTPIPQSGSDAQSCIPGNAPETGKVLEIIDGSTIKVLINEKVYVVRYLGVQAPATTSPYYAAAAYENSQLVFAREITLIKDTTDLDENGRMLRYVLQGGLFINQAMLEKGLASATGSAISCQGVFQGAEQSAKANRLGIWTTP